MCKTPIFLRKISPGCSEGVSACRKHLKPGVWRLCVKRKDPRECQAWSHSHGQWGPTARWWPTPSQWWQHAVGTRRWGSSHGSSGLMGIISVLQDEKSYADGQSWHLHWTVHLKIVRWYILCYVYVSTIKNGGKKGDLCTVCFLLWSYEEPWK